MNDARLRFEGRAVHALDGVSAETPHGVAGERRIAAREFPVAEEVLRIARLVDGAVAVIAECV